MVSKVSVIVPVYKAEKYIERCARSLFEQTLDKIEYIFINDCSPDNSMTILENTIKEYLCRKDQIKIINQQNNVGLAAVRRIGFQYAEGEFVTTCDSDDWVDHNMYKMMYNKAIKTNADIVFCDYYTTDGNRKRVCRTKSVSTPINYIKDMLYHKSSWSLCNKIFRRTLFNLPIIYPDKSMGEDLTLTLQLVFYSKKVLSIDKPLYYYYTNPFSIVNNKNKECTYSKFSQAMENCRIIYKFYENKDIYLKVKGGLTSLHYHVKCLLLPIIADKTYYQIWKNTFPHIEREILKDSNNSLRERLKCLLILLHLYPRITNCLKITHCK